MITIYNLRTHLICHRLYNSPQQQSFHLCTTENMNATENTDAVVNQLLNISQIVYVTFGLIILVLGTIGNLFDIISFVRLESLKTLASSLFLLASFIGSEIMLITGILLPIVQGLIALNTIVGAIMICKIRWYFRTVSGTFSLTCVCFAAIDRYLVSCIDIRRHRLITFTRARWTIFTAASFWLIVLSPYALFQFGSLQYITIEYSIDHLCTHLEKFGRTTSNIFAKQTSLRSNHSNDYCSSSCHLFYEYTEYDLADLCSIHKFSIKEYTASSTRKFYR
jgi:hypothetical protein